MVQERTDRESEIRDRRLKLLKLHAEIKTSVHILVQLAGRAE